MFAKTFAAFACLASAALSTATMGQGVLPTQALDFSENPPTCAVGAACDRLELANTDGAIFRADFETWSLNALDGQGITFKVKLDTPMPIVLNLTAAAAIVAGNPDCALSVHANGKPVVTNYADTNFQWHPIEIDIGRNVLEQGWNTITIALEEFATTQMFIERLTVSSFATPQRLISSRGHLDVDLYVQFGIAAVTGALDAKGDPIEGNVWTRAYGVNPPQEDPRNPGQWLPGLQLIPGPTLVYEPGDLLEVNFVNQLDTDTNQWLEAFENSITTGNKDDITAHVTHEVNIPHNADNTNLHTHGLHVDPRQDDVLKLIIPPNDSPDEYQPSLREYIPNATENGGNGDFWTWQYNYRIPADHLPGTHWYHAHKHGSTSTHVENGMAGTMVIRPRDEANTFAPGLWSADAEENHDRVMVLQEVANYGTQQGAGKATDLTPGKNVKNVPPGAPDITVNGVHQPTLQLIPGQVERWRFIAAGANHRTSSYLWLGKKTGDVDEWNVPIYDDAVPLHDDEDTPQMYLVALDGITLKSPVKITAATPAVVGAGNRADFLIRVPDAGTYAIFKNYPQNPTKAAVKADRTGRKKQLYTAGVSGPKAPHARRPDSKTDLRIDPFDLATTYDGFTKPWPIEVSPSGTLVRQSDNDGKRTPDTNDKQPMVPLLRAVAAAGNRVGIAFTPKPEQFPDVGWEPLQHLGGGQLDQQLLMFVNVGADGDPDNGTIPTDLRRVHLSPFSPTGSAAQLTRLDDQGRRAAGAPGYASPIHDADLNVAPLAMVFDQSGIQFNYRDPDGDDDPQAMQQFSINGRQFGLQDFAGNPMAETHIQTPVPTEEYTIDEQDREGDLLGEYNFAGAKLWTNEIAAIDGNAFWTNPAYYVPIVEDPAGYFTYDYNNKNLRPPTYADVTGLKRPSQPVAQSAQEWILINNSSIFHPFHIHISPFFVTEVGQINYDPKSCEWTTRYIYEDPNGTELTRQPFEKEASGSALQYVVGNWWDVMMIPPRGYVKFKTWVNVPWQSEDNTTVEDNSNNVASWVFHCHILRHEDRGMMMIVKTKKAK